jgi:hypothetical protein
VEWAQWALEVARVIAWPLVIMAVLRWLREPIRERLGNVEKVSALGVDLELAARRVEREVREVADVLVDSATSAGVSEELQQSLHERVEVQVDVTRGAAPAGPAQTVYPDPIQPQLTDAQRSDPSRVSCRLRV